MASEGDKEGRGHRPLPVRPLPSVPKPALEERKPRTSSRPASVQLSRNLSSFGINVEAASATPPPATMPPMPSDQRSVAASLRTRQGTETSSNPLSDADDEEESIDAAARRASVATNATGRESIFELHVAQRVDITPSTSRIERLGERAGSAPITPDTAIATSRSPQPMPSTSTFAMRKKHDEAEASPMPSSSASRTRLTSANDHDSSAPPTALPVTATLSSKPAGAGAAVAVTASPSVRAPLPAKRPRDVRIPELPHEHVPRAPTGGMYWSKAPVHGRLPYHPMRAHSCTRVDSALWLFGGCDTRTCYRDVWRLDLDTWAWSKPKVAGDTPPLCRAHTATHVGAKADDKRIYIFGGGEGPSYFSTTYCLDTVTLLWSKPAAYGQVPSARRAHAALAYKESFIVFGGGNGSRALNDVFACDVSDPTALEWRQLETTGPSPKQRGYHTFTRVNSKAIVFGGSDGGECFSDMHILDLETLVWTKVDEPPILYPRLSHAATQVGCLLVIWGGHDGIDYSNCVLVFNLVTLAWEVRDAWGVPPSPRGYATVCYYDSRLIVIGGFGTLFCLSVMVAGADEEGADGKKTFDDTHILDLGADSFNALITRWNGPLGS